MSKVHSPKWRSKLHLQSTWRRRQQLRHLERRMKLRRRDLKAMNRGEAHKYWSALKRRKAGR